jgi:hypothetical protein
MDRRKRGMKKIINALDGGRMETSSGQISGSHGSVYEDGYLLGCCAV